MKNFTRTAALAAGLLFAAGAALAQTTYNTYGVIGPGSPGGDWVLSDGVNALTRSTTNPDLWTATLTMRAGEFKFRGNNDWAYNYGGPGFGTGWPAAAGTPNGPVITAVAGRYNVLLNTATGAYSFSVASATREGSTANLGLSLLPNPASEATRVVYSLPAAASVSLGIYNALGQVVRQLPTQRQSAGPQELPLSRLGLAPGIYVVRLQADDQLQAVRLLVQ